MPSLSMYEATVPPFVKTLTNMKAVLEKAVAHAQAKKIEETVFLNARLYPDMFPLADQVRIATDIARGTATRLTGGEPATYQDDEKTFAELLSRIDRAIGDLKALDPKKFEGTDTREITRPVRGEPHTFTGLNYILHFAAPNVYFHTTTAYDILRHNGVEIGKQDFLGKID
jgi:hypothetical protein